MGGINFKPTHLVLSLLIESLTSYKSRRYIGSKYSANRDSMSIMLACYTNEQAVFNHTLFMKVRMQLLINNYYFVYCGMHYIEVVHTKRFHLRSRQSFGQKNIEKLVLF